MLLPSRKPSSSYSLLKFVYVTSQLRHSLVVHPLLRKILDPPLQARLIVVTAGLRHLYEVDLRRIYNAKIIRFFFATSITLSCYNCLRHSD